MAELLGPSHDDALDSTLDGERAAQAEIKQEIKAEAVEYVEYSEEQVKQEPVEEESSDSDPGPEQERLLYQQLMVSVVTIA